ncbi:MAG: OmpH family outer membrane protein [Bacteroidota bacterium]|nr:OmpH family outer membrane protein [Bacteroidota bacterium]MDP4233529.1 OmpH family outer membrane protein [Bacteroidota bacterium]MDP4244046.1 OmpH family outer membrane protein [Bacteroidota bacterium]MDP4287715.1 OmpH family outer membrane protein [Bacteroidota bacterium]
MTTFVQRVALIGLAVLGMSLSTGTSLRAQKMGVVDVQAVLNSMPEVVAANQKLEAQRQVWLDTLKTMQTQYQAKLDTYSKVGETGTPEFKKKAQDDLTTLQESFTKFQTAKFGQEGELAQIQQQLLKPIYEKLQTTLAAYAKKDKLEIIFQKSSTVYTADAVDITTKFQDYLKAQAAK